MTREEAVLVFMGKLEVLRNPSCPAIARGYVGYSKEIIEDILQARNELLKARGEYA